jgi:glycine/D-amino acid oxidase-like deaminating enzyme
MLIEPPVYLQALLDDVARMGGRIEVRELGSPADVEALPEPIVVNCTGLGARSLFGDDELRPIKGQLVFQLPQPEVDYIALHGEAYMFPRRDGILLGSTYERGIFDVEPTEAGNLRIIQGAAALFAQLKR